MIRLSIDMTPGDIADSFAFDPDALASFLVALANNIDPQTIKDCCACLAAHYEPDETNPIEGFLDMLVQGRLDAIDRLNMEASE
jgi:hypothetical protein